MYVTKQKDEPIQASETDAQNEPGVAIEVTPEMIRAGVAEIAGFYWDTEDSADAVRRIFEAMMSSRRTSEKKSAIFRLL
jgi:hypothetical protein